MGAWIGIGVLAVAVVSVVAYRRYGETRGHPERHWQRTDEVFRDPSTGRLMRVWLDGKGDRHYLSD